MGKTLEIDIAPDGNVSIEAMGFVGSACQAATLPFEQALGGAVQTTSKPELARVATDQHLQQRGY